MDAKIKTEWVAELRSGKRRQCQGELHTVSGAYCCLGVLYEVAGEAWSAPDFSAYRTYEGDYGLLPPDLLTKLDISDDQQRELAKMNDSGVPFSAIADFIEANL